MKQITDQDLIKKIAKGDSKAFESLFNKYGDLVYGVSCKLIKDKARAEDMTQTTWIKVLTESKNFTADYTSKNSVKAWIMKINRNLIIDQFRSEKKWNSVDIDETPELSDDHEMQVDQMISIEQKDKFAKLFAQLDEREKIVLTMVMVDEKNYAEIARDLNISVGGIKTIVFRAKNKLAELLNESEGGPHER
jgi:RNA polymerase sigma-70 factor, ECF subfamily